MLSLVDLMMPEQEREKPAPDLTAAFERANTPDEKQIPDVMAAFEQAANGATRPATDSDGHGESKPKKLFRWPYLDQDNSKERGR